MCDIMCHIYSSSADWNLQWTRERKLTRLCGKYIINTVNDNNSNNQAQGMYVM